MRCEEVHEYLAERLAGSLSDRLSGSVHSHVRSHMLSCPECCEELEDFEEMQSVLRSIPLEPCDPSAMRARFDLLAGAKEMKGPRISAKRLWPLNRPFKMIFSLILALVVITASVIAGRQAMKWISMARIVPTVPTQTSGPAAAPVRTGAMSGQIRIANGEAPRKVRVAVIAVPKAGVPSLEIAVETSDDGRYRLDNIPAGQYYVLASSVEAPTYYPGSPDIAGATIVSVRAGAVLEGIDFPRTAAVVKPVPAPISSQNAEINGKARFEDGREVSETQLVTVDVTVRHETGDRLPYKPDTSIVFTSSTGAFRVEASCVVGNLFRAAVPANERFTVSVSNVASGYSVQSIVDADRTDLMHGGLFTAAQRVSSPSRIVVTLKKN